MREKLLWTVTVFRETSEVLYQPASQLSPKVSRLMMMLLENEVCLWSKLEKPFNIKHKNADRGYDKILKDQEFLNVQEADWNFAMVSVNNKELAKEEERIFARKAEGTYQKERVKMEKKRQGSGQTIKGESGSSRSDVNASPPWRLRGRNKDSEWK